MPWVASKMSIKVHSPVRMTLKPLLAIRRCMCTFGKQLVLSVCWFACSLLSDPYYQSTCLSVCLSFCPVSSPVHPLPVDWFGWNLVVRTHLGSNSLLLSFIHLRPLAAELWTKKRSARTTSPTGLSVCLSVCLYLGDVFVKYIVYSKLGRLYTVGSDYNSDCSVLCMTHVLFIALSYFVCLCLVWCQFELFPTSIIIILFITSLRWA